MKQNVIWRLLFVIIAMLSFVACTSDDEKIEYTSDEIIDMLVGTWEVGGQLIITYNGNEANNVYDSYKGTIVFARSGNYVKSYIKITETDINDGNIYDRYDSFISSSKNKGCCKVYKKDGKPCIQFGNDEEYGYGLFEIVSLSKNSFKMVLDEDYENHSNWVKGCHVHMTLQTQ